jgi:hypothetical protein
MLLDVKVVCGSFQIKDQRLMSHYLTWRFCCRRRSRPYSSSSTEVIHTDGQFKFSQMLVLQEYGIEVMMEYKIPKIRSGWPV